jgi:hypothetical protein
MAMGELDRENRRQAKLDVFESTSAAALMGRQLLEWSGIDPDDADAVEQFGEAIGWSSIPTACSEIAATVLARH